MCRGIRDESVAELDWRKKIKNIKEKKEQI